MKLTARSLVPFAVATLLVGAAPSVAAADPAPSSHHVVITSTARVLKSQPNGTAIVTGTVDGTLGKGAVVSRRTTDGSRDETSRGTMYFPRGSVRGTSVLEITRTGDRALVSGYLKVTGGTGRYVGARGRLAVKGVGDLTSQVITLTFKGHFTY